MDEQKNKILLGMKKQGFGSMKYNGYGGKLELGETEKQAAVREMFEESEVKVMEEHLEKMAVLNFEFPYQKDWNQVVHVFFAKKWQGIPKPSKEMDPFWFDIKDLPYEKMWADDRHWLPRILDGKQINGHFSFKEDNSTIADYRIAETKDINKQDI